MANANENAAVEQNVQPVEENNVAENAAVETSNPSDYANIIKNLLNNGAKRFNRLKVKNVTISDEESYTRLGITLATKIPANVLDEQTATYKEGLHNVMFSSVYAVIGAMKEDDELSFAANTVLESPKILNVLMNGGEIDVIQQRVAASEEYRNPFTTRTDPEIRVYDHDVIVNHIVKIRPSKVGIKGLDRLIDKLMGF